MSNERILVVEDSVVTSTIIRATLEKIGYTVAGVVDNGPDSITAAADLKPDLILMDIILKGTMTGIEAAREIREKLDIPVIFLTAQSDDSTIDTAVTADAFGYLIKPPDDLTLKTTIQITLYKHALDEKLQVRERTITVLLNAVPDALALADNRKKIVAVNRSMAEKMGKAGSPITGISVEELVESGVVSIPPEKIDSLYESGKPAHFENQAGDKWFETSIYPIQDRSGATVTLAIQSHDITYRKYLEEERNRSLID